MKREPGKYWISRWAKSLSYHLTFLAIDPVGHVLHTWLRVLGVGFRVWGSGCGVQGSGCRVQGAGCRVWGFRVQVKVSGL